MNRGSNEFGAPWSGTLKFMTALCCAVCLGVAVAGAVRVEMPMPVRIAMMLTPLLLLGGAAFTVRGYELWNGELLIRRLGWSYHLELRSLKSATPDPTAMRWSIRLVGNGGLFSFTGWFRNAKLGRFRVFGTDPKWSVVLRFENRTVVVTPDAPERFVEVLRKRGVLPSPPSNPRPGAT